ncbi:hypothetical protein AYJ57_18060 [Salipiger sp. CCB-MM3]|nr:hypothetical protein AYJ57_18060 [Salipiger sp. CCB-MM3]
MSAPRSLFEYTSFSWQQSALHGQSYEEALISTVDDFRFEGDAVPEISIQSTKLIRSKSSIHHVRSTGHMITAQQDSSVTAMFPLQGRQIVDDGDEVSGAGLDQSLTLRPSRRSTWVKPQSTKLFEAVMLKVPEEFVGTRALRVPAQRERAAAMVGDCA